MKKIVVTLLLGLFTFPTAFALDGNEVERNQISRIIATRVQNVQKNNVQRAIASAHAATNDVFKRYPNAKKLPALAKTYAVLSYKTYTGRPAGFSLREYPNPFASHKVRVPAVLVETDSRYLSMAVPVSVFNAMRAEDADSFGVTVSLVQFSQGRFDYTKSVSFKLDKAGCPEGARYDLSKAFGLCVFNVPVVKELNDTFKGFFATHRKELNMKKLGAAFKK